MSQTLSVHKVKGEFYGFKQMIGGHRFYFSRNLGIDRQTAANARKAATAAGIISGEWDRLKLSGATAWTPNDLERVKTLSTVAVMGAQVISPAASPFQAETPARIERDATLSPSIGLHQAVDGYVERRKQDAKAGQITDTHSTGIAYNLKRFKKHVADRPLNGFNLDECRSIVNHFASRPTFDGGKKIGVRMAAATVVGTLNTVRAFFSDAADRGDWTAPATLDKCFSFDRDKLQTETEQDATATVKTFTIPELASIWRATRSDRQRLYILLGLNCGFTQKEIATLRLAHCHLDAVDKEGNARPYIKRRRNKTRAKVKTEWRWRLWPETAYLLNKEMAKTNPEGLALLSEKGGRLTDTTASSYFDLIRKPWTDAIKAANHLKDLFDKEGGKHTLVSVRPLGFKYLRKTASNLIRKIGGKDTAETFLAHTESGMGKHYHNPDFKRVGRSIRKLRLRLEPMLKMKKIEGFSNKERQTVKA